ncbi:MAG: hypothetical protein AMJ77_05425 [Dehalococcoidia bacterium SM23_28_2]|nr:MAG: hypothetical protein AMJ77_05425 [Dehalococcoidia bacterium SM23_28_2]
MSKRIAVLQLARLLGKEEFYRRLSLDEGLEPEELSDTQMALLRLLVDERLKELVRGLAAEVVASDDVTDVVSGVAYLEDRLSFFSELLTASQREKVRDGFRSFASRW